jgi:hypothetical protein
VVGKVEAVRRQVISRGARGDVHPFVLLATCFAATIAVQELATVEICLLDAVTGVPTPARVLAGISLGCDTVTDAYLLKTR